MEYRNKKEYSMSKIKLITIETLLEMQENNESFTLVDTLTRMDRSEYTKSE